MAGFEKVYGQGGELQRVSVTGEGADFVFISGPYEGMTVDFMFTASSPQGVTMMNKHFELNWRSTAQQIIDHASKADIVPLDFRNLLPAHQQTVLDLINTLPPAQSTKFVIIR